MGRLKNVSGEVQELLKKSVKIIFIYLLQTCI